MKKGYFGADYYPEHWPESRWPVDARLMQEMGLQVVRMAEFSWARLEPAEGVYDFSWLDRAIALLCEHGIDTVIGTPTATPPAWIIEQNPEILPIDSQGRVRGFGGRHHDCQSQAAYHYHIERLVTAMAEHYARMPGVIGWQIDNEFGNSHQDLCHCPSCRQSFQAWLKERYQTIEALNAAWGTVFWSQTYNHFGQIPTPVLLPTDHGHNPAHLLAWKRFCSDLIVRFQERQVAIIRRICPDQFITHNYMGFADKVNYFDLGRSLDFVCHDQYPMAFYMENPPWRGAGELAAALDLMRATRRQPFWIMEQQAGPAGWTTIGRTPRPGQLRLWTAQAIAHGADSVVYFRWRTCAFGTEAYWHGILPHSGQPGRRYEELQKTVQEMQPLLDQIQGAMPQAETAILYSYDQKWALDIQPHHPKLEYIRQVMAYYQPVFEQNVPIDFVSPADDLSGYKLVIAPLQFLTEANLSQRLYDYVRFGGHLVLTMRSGVKDQDHACLTDGELPGPFRDLLGITIRDYDCLRDTDVGLRWLSSDDEADCRGDKWADLVTPEGAKVLAAYTSEYYAGQAAVTVHDYGRGKAYYVGSEPDADFLSIFTAEILAQAGIASLGRPQPAVELTCRQTDTTRYLFALNHADKPVNLELDAGWQPLIGGYELGAYDYAVFQREAAK